MPTVERRIREERRDRLRLIGITMRRHVAHASLVWLETAERRFRNEPVERFTRPLLNWPTCGDCRAPLAAIPWRPDAYDGYCPCYVCTFCDTDRLREWAERVERLAAKEPAA